MSQAVAPPAVLSRYLPVLRRALLLFRECGMNQDGPRMYVCGSIAYALHTVPGLLRHFADEKEEFVRLDAVWPGSFLPRRLRKEYTDFFAASPDETAVNVSALEPAEFARALRELYWLLMLFRWHWWLNHLKPLEQTFASYLTPERCGQAALDALYHGNLADEYLRCLDRVLAGGSFDPAAFWTAAASRLAALPGSPTHDWRGICAWQLEHIHDPA